MIENKNRTTLIIDGNWLLMSRLGMMMKDFSKDQSEQQLEAAKNNMLDFLAQSVNKQINFWGNNIDNFIMVQDGGSWRRHFPKPKLYTEEYKGNRVQDTEVNWDYIWSTLRTFCEIFKNNNISCISERNIEGDDWCWYWSRYLNHEGINCIIWSSDADLKQLVQRDESTQAWTAWYNDKAGLVLSEKFEISEMDTLMFFESKDPVIESLESNVSKVNFINPDDIVMYKVICGDAGDNIKPLIQVPSVTKTGKTRILGVSEKEWLTIKEARKIDNIEQFKEDRLGIIRALKQLKRFTENKYSEEDMLEMFQYNLDLVRLNKENIPVAQQKDMNKHKDEYLIANLDYIRNNYKVLSSDPNRNDLKELFDDLPF